MKNVILVRGFSGPPYRNILEIIEFFAALRLCQAAGPGHARALGKEVLRSDHDQSAIGDGQIPIRAAPRGDFPSEIHRRFKKDGVV